MQQDAFHTPRGPATLIFGDDARRRARLEALAIEAGGRIAAIGSLHAAPDGLAGQAGSAVLVLDLGDDEDASDHLFDAARAAVVRGVAVLVIFGPALIDLVSARLPGAEPVVGFSEDEIEASLRRLLRRRDGVAEPSAEENARRLAALSEETARIARALASLSEQVEAPAPAAQTQDAAAALAIARALIRLRRMREQFLDRALFADPAWDMLLDLFAAQLEARRVAVSSLCIAAAVPPTTALRWIGAMTEQGLLLREADPDDGRRVFIVLSAAAAGAMAQYVAAAGRVVAVSRP